MKIHCQLEAQDYVDAMFLHMRPRPVFKWVGIFLVVVFLLFSLLLIRDSVANRHLKSETVITLGAFIYLALSFSVSVPWRAGKIFRQQKSLQEPCDMEITEEGVYVSSQTGHANLKWKNFYKYKIGKKVVLVYASDVIFHIFPKRWFSGRELIVFEDYIRNAIDKKNA